MQSQTVSNNQVYQSKFTFLRRALQSNALFSLLTGLVFIVAAGPVARFLGANIPIAIVLVVGLSLLPFGYGVYRVAAQPEIVPRHASKITVMDVTWVIGSYLLLVLAWDAFSVAGRWLVALQAEAVFTFAVLQFIGLRRLQK
jgi:uncharacterized membrane protein